MQKKDHIFICGGNSSSRATSGCLRSQGSFLGFLLFPTAPPSATDLFSTLSLFRSDFPQCFWNGAERSNHHRYFFHFHLPNLMKFPAWPVLDTFLTISFEKPLNLPAQLLSIRWHTFFALSKTTNMISLNVKVYTTLRSLSRIQKYLSWKATKNLFHAFITTRLDMCNSLIYGFRQ